MSATWAKLIAGFSVFSVPGSYITIRDSLLAHNTAYEAGGIRFDSGGELINSTVTDQAGKIDEIAKIEAAWFGKMPRVAGPDELRNMLLHVIRNSGWPVVAADRAPRNGIVTLGRPVRRGGRR